METLKIPLSEISFEIGKNPFDFELEIDKEYLHMDPSGNLFCTVKTMTITDPIKKIGEFWGSFETLHKYLNTNIYWGKVEYLNDYSSENNIEWRQYSEDEVRHIINSYKYEAKYFYEESISITTSLIFHENNNDDKTAGYNLERGTGEKFKELNMSYYKKRQYYVIIK